MKLGKVFPILILLIGVILLVYMIIYEGEPGALPLLLILTGIAWLIFRHFRSGIKNNE